MAASPTSSSYSSFSSPFTLSPSEEPSSEFGALPIAALKDKIIDKITENRVTLIIGEPGCGKSSQVPQFLLEKNMEPILCTQPRRFAVVAVARMVAKARKCEVGGEIGFHIGHSRVFSASSKIIFKTAGVLLDEMRERGPNALKYKVIILDEVHERSVESDLVLVCVKQFLLKNSGFRLVLMSATADIARYKEYFKDLGRGERVEVLAIPNTIRRNIFQRKVIYLEQVTKLLGMQTEDLLLTYCNGESPLIAEAGIGVEVHKLIHNLLLHIHKNEPDIEKSILVFLPTYYSLEQQWALLMPFDSTFKVHILHRSIDIDQALKAMKIWKSHRKVILATNIAESSVTIPKVGYVVDSCRSLQVFWDSNRKAESAGLVWVSKSQAEQRKGRTGRTCDGYVFRLVTGSFFSQLVEYEPPAILRLSLRQQILLLCCAQSKAINDPKVLLQKALDPPDLGVIEDALSLLVHIHAIEKASSRIRYDPTFYGQLLSSFTLSFDASVLVLKFGEIGLLREGIIIGILMDMQPLPIVRPFGQETLHMVYTGDYYVGDNKNSGKKEVQYIANWCAFQFWQSVFKDKYRLKHLKSLLQPDSAEGAVTMLPKIEEEWCLSHNLVQSALQLVADTYDEILSSLHRFRPKCLVNFDKVPLFRGPYEFWHKCSDNWEQIGDVDALVVHDKDFEVDIRKGKCLSLPFVSSNHIQVTKMANKLAEIVKEMRFQLFEGSSRDKKRHAPDHSHDAAKGPPLCKYFTKGQCNKQSHCLYSHSLQANSPRCKFFFSLQGCRNADTCFYSHDFTPSVAVSSMGNLCVPEDQDAYAESLLRLLPSPRDGCILLMDDNDLHFSGHFALHCDPSSIITTSSLQSEPVIDPSLNGVKILWGLSHPYETILSEGGESPIPWNDIECVLWFPQIHGGNLEEQEGALKAFFEYLAIRILADALFEVKVIITMSNIRFSQFQVEKLARDSLFFLKDSFPYDEESFGKITDDIRTRNPMQVPKPVSYVFGWHPPVNVTLEECAVFSQLLHNSHWVPEGWLAWDI